MELLRLRKRLVVAQRGHKLLKDKLDGLMKEFLDIAAEYKRYRIAVDDELPYVLKLFVLAEASSSRADHRGRPRKHAAGPSDHLAAPAAS